MTIGRLDLTLNYPERQASYPVSVRRAKCSSSASFRFLLTKDTLAFDYKIPVITALLRLEVYILSLLRIDTCPAHIVWTPTSGLAVSLNATTLLECALIVCGKATPAHCEACKAVQTIAQVEGL